MASAAHRVLRLTSPLTHGADVRALQAAVNARGKSRGTDPLTLDSAYGPETAAAVREVGYLLGLADSTLAKGATVGVQRIIRNPKLRTPIQRRRAAQRKTTSAGGKAAVRWAISQIGTHEQPANSNTGPHIAEWQRAVGMGPGPWCGAFAVASAKAGGAAVTYQTRYTPTIRPNAQNKVGGYRGWISDKRDFDQAEPGDHVVFDWQPGTGADHVGVLESVDLDAFTITCVEGNTSGSGSQDNGGIVLRKTRPMSQVQGIAQVRWPS